MSKKGVSFASIHSEASGLCLETSFFRFTFPEKKSMFLVLKLKSIFSERVDYKLPILSSSLFKGSICFMKRVLSFPVKDSPVGRFNRRAST